jgi:hypothetical protein
MRATNGAMIGKGEISQVEKVEKTESDLGTDDGPERFNEG